MKYIITIKALVDTDDYDNVKNNESDLLQLGMAMIRGEADWPQTQSVKVEEF